MRLSVHPQFCCERIQRAQLKLESVVRDGGSL